MALRPATLDIDLTGFASTVVAGLLAVATVVPPASAQTAAPQPPPIVTEPAPSPPPLVLVSMSQRGRIADLVARAIAPRLSQTLGREVRVGTWSDGDGRSAVEAVLRAPADGLAILIADTRIAARDAATSRKRDGAQPVAGLVPLARLTERPLVLVTGMAQPLRNFDDLVSAARRRRSGITLAVTARGGPLHLAGARLDAALGGGLTLMPMTMGGASITAVLEKKAQVALAALPTALAFARKGQLRILASLSASRPASLRTVPTLTERRIPVTASLWTAAFVPPATPLETRAMLDREFAAALAARETITALRHLQEDAAYLSGDAARAFWESEQRAVAQAQRFLAKAGGR